MGTCLSPFLSMILQMTPLFKISRVSCTVLSRISNSFIIYQGLNKRSYDRDSTSINRDFRILFLRFLLYFIHFEITGYPCNLIGSQQCDLFPNRTMFCSKSHLYLSQWEWEWENFGSCNFGLKSYLWFQIELALRVWFLTKLHSTQFNYHY